MTHLNSDEQINSFEQLCQDLESSGDIYIEWAKINIAEQIAQALRREDVSKAELARRLNKSRAYITQILQGGANFTIESLVRIALTLNCDFDFRLKPKSFIQSWQPIGNVTSIEEWRRTHGGVSLSTEATYLTDESLAA